MRALLGERGLVIPMVMQSLMTVVTVMVAMQLIYREGVVKGKRVVVGGLGVLF